MNKQIGNEATSEDAREAINLMKYMMDTTMIDYATRKVDVDNFNVRIT